MAELRGGSTVGGFPTESTKESQEKVNTHAADTTLHVTVAKRTAVDATTAANGFIAAADKSKLD